jgi:hypothetical protein
MSKETTQGKEGAGAAAAKATAFVVAKVDGKYVRLLNKESAPPDVEVITEATVAEMTKDAIGELYSAIAGVSPKKFKDKRVAVESLAYQVAKMSVFDPNAPKPEPAAKGAKPVKAAADGDKKYARKTPDTFELLQPAELDKVMRGLAPQARELVLIMTDLAKEKGATSFSGTDLNEKLKIPEVGARLRTKQDPLRILQYYKGKLISVGLIRVS